MFQKVKDQILVGQYKTLGNSQYVVEISAQTC